MTGLELKKIVWANIRRYREYRKWTQAQLAEKMGISINFLSDIENEKKWFSPVNMAKFAMVLNIEPYELFKPPEVPEPAVSALFSQIKLPCNIEPLIVYSIRKERRCHLYRNFMEY